MVDLFGCRYQEPIPTLQLVRQLASVMQEYTQRGGVRPFGVSLLICGFDLAGKPALFQVDPSVRHCTPHCHRIIGSHLYRTFLQGSYFAWKASAIGKNMVNAKTFLEKRFSDELELEDAIHTAILTLKVRLASHAYDAPVLIPVCQNRRRDLKGK